MDSSQVKPITAIVQNFGWRQVVPIYIDAEHDNGIMPFLIDALQQIDVRVADRIIIPPFATDDQIHEQLLKPQRTRIQSSIFIVHLTTPLCSRLFIIAKETYMMNGGSAWLTTSWITNSLPSLNATAMKSMLGVIGVRPYVPETTQLQEFKLRWKQRFRKDYPTIIDISELDVLGLWAYDATHALAMAIEQVIPISSSQQYGPKLCKALSRVAFQGMAGNMSLVDGRLQTSAFEVVNVDGRQARTVVFWTQTNGLKQEMRNRSPEPDNTLGPIIWPGDSLTVPPGWGYYVFRIGVAVEDGFDEFVKVTRDPSTDYITDFSGFSIEVFEAVLKLLPHPIMYELTPLESSDCRPKS